MTDTDDTPKRRTKPTNRNPDFEAALGARIRSARVAAGKSMGALGAAVGISHQQVQKYEAGKDRVAVSTLVAMAAAVGVHPGSFFSDDLSAPLGTLSDLRAAQRLGERIARLRDPDVVRRLASFINALVDEQDYKPSDGAAKANGHAPDDDDP